MDVLHTAIEVSDLESMVGFYEGLLGLECTREFRTDDVHNYYVGGSGPAEIQFRVVETPPEPAGIVHLAIAAEDVDAVVDAAVADWDSEVVMAPRTLDRVDRRIAFVTDPEGYTVELVEEL